MKKVMYFDSLKNLKRIMQETKNTPFSMWAKVVTLAVMNMRCERIVFDKGSKTHPYIMMRQNIDEAIVLFRSLRDVSFIEDEQKGILKGKSKIKEKKHRELFNEMWDRYDDGLFEGYIKRYVYRLKVNNLIPLIKGKTCVDLGCGNGVFCFALLRCGAKHVTGIDFGEKSISYAQNVARRKKLVQSTCFKKATVYKTGLASNKFDFAIQNGVFHHLANEDAAIQEAHRIVKPHGWFWYYTDGAGAIAADLWDTSVEILKDVPVLFIENVLVNMNVGRNKIVHLTDGLSATYHHTTWKSMTGRLARYGFGEFQRLSGGFDTDFDLDRIKKDPYGREKFGEGDLRILCQSLGR